MGLLVATGRDSSAAVLVRPILESLCLSAWALYRADDIQLSSAFENKISFPSVASLVSQLESTAECRWIGFEQKSLNVRAFHALAHPSMLQLSKRYSPDAGSGAFNTDECIRLLWLADTLALTNIGVFSVAMDITSIEKWAAKEMTRVMDSQGIAWEGWGQLPRSTKSFGLRTPLINSTSP
ncbi:MAG: hypothetical protein LCH70_06340 [Proteobacteria bacterium]|nr:hypothetical protein [Pseudomonadota bacterium]